MDTLTRDDLEALIEPRGGRCVSLHMSAFRKGTEQRQNVVRFSNLRFFRIVDRCLHPLLRDQSAPLVLAGVACRDSLRRYRGPAMGLPQYLERRDATAPRARERRR